MNIRFHPHSKLRIQERGGTEQEVVSTLTHGEQFPAKYGRTGFRRNFEFNGQWQGNQYANKQLEVYAVKENDEWLVLTVIIKYF